MTQKIRKTVLTRTKAARETQLKEEDDTVEVIDLTKKKPLQDLPTSTTPPTSACQSYVEPTSEVLPIITTSNVIKASHDYNLQQHMQHELLHMQSLEVKLKYLLI